MIRLNHVELSPALRRSTRVRGITASRPGPSEEGGKSASALITHTTYFCFSILSIVLWTNFAFLRIEWRPVDYKLRDANPGRENADMRCRYHFRLWLGTPRRRLIPNPRRLFDPDATILVQKKIIPKPHINVQVSDPHRHLAFRKYI